MGRYYDGDIEGKFWFGIQPSNAPERFGAIGYLHYSFSEEDIPTVEEELNSIKQELGEYKEKLDKFFEKNSSYNYKMLVDAGFPGDKIGHLLEEYADLLLGEKILNCLKQTGQCSFDCEC